IVTSQRSKQLPNHLLVTESSLSIQGIGGSCGREDAYGSTCASVTPTGNRARKTSFIPPSSPLEIGAAGTASLSNCAYSASSARCFSSARPAIFGFTTKTGHLPAGLNARGFGEFGGGCASNTKRRSHTSTLGSRCVAPTWSLPILSIFQNANCG